MGISDIFERRKTPTNYRLTTILIGVALALTLSACSSSQDGHNPATNPNAGPTVALTNPTASAPANWIQYQVAGTTISFWGPPGAQIDGSVTNAGDLNQTIYSFTTTTSYTDNYLHGVNIQLDTTDGSIDSYKVAVPPGTTETGIGTFDYLNATVPGADQAAVRTQSHANGDATNYALLLVTGSQLFVVSPETPADGGPASTDVNDDLLALQLMNVEISGGPTSTATS